MSEPDTRISSFTTIDGLTFVVGERINDRTPELVERIIRLPDGVSLQVHGSHHLVLGYDLTRVKPGTICEE